MELSLFSSLASPPILALLAAIPAAAMILLLYRRRDSDPLQPYPLLGFLPQFLKNRHRFLDWMTDVLAASPNNTFTFSRPGNVRGVLTANPANVEHMIKANFDNYHKGPAFVSVMEDFLGRGLLTADGDLWRAQRRTSSPEFNSRTLRNFTVESVQREVRERLLPLLRRSAAAGGAVLDLQDVLERFGFDNICRLAFNDDPACLGDEREEGEGKRRLAGFAPAFAGAINESVDRFQYAIPGMWRLKKLLNVGSERRLRECIATVHGFALGIIRSRKQEERGSPAGAAAALHHDLLSRFLAGEDNSEGYLRDIVINFIIAGRETTSSALTWFFWLLSSRPEVEGKILEELRSVRAAGRSPGNEGGGGEETFGFEELKEMHYLHAAISESMRLYPPVSVYSVSCLADDVLPDGTFVGKGWFLSYISYSMGRMPAVWGEDCEEYRPERWLDEAGRFRPESQYKYPVFHGGPRVCLGKEMAYIQMKSIAACVLERFAVEVEEEGRCPEKALSLTLRMKGGLPVRVRERPAASA